VAELAGPSVLSAFAQVANRDPGASLEDRLVASGWVEGQPGSGGLHRRWQQGDIVAIQFGRGADAFIEVTLEMAKPDSEDPHSEDRLTAEFENRFKRNVARASAELGEPAYLGSYGDEGFPDDLDAVMTALWPADSGGVGLNFKHEDWGAPFRITATAR
jgi:hypothetical protein